MIYLTDYDAQYWNAINEWLDNEKGTAALMGNLEGESNLIPYRLQGDYTADYQKSKEYTQSVDNGTYTKYSFINDGRGYGAAQWTFSTRKEQLYEMWEDGHYDSIGSFDLSIAMLKQEMAQSYPDVLDVLKTTTDIKTASDYVLHHFEMPEDQSETVEAERAGWAQGFYDRFAGSTPAPPLPQSPKGGMPLWMYLRKEG